MSGLIAHQGGWDEILLVIAPLIVLAGLLRMANGRAKAKLAEQQAQEPTPPTPPDPSEAS